MRCPRCGLDAPDEDALFCARCGGILRPRARARGGERPRRPGRLGVVGALAAALGRSLSRGGWPTACGAACVAFLAALCVGAYLLVAAKLGHPALGAGANPVSVFGAVVILALGSLGSAVRVADLEIRALPLGLLAVVGWSLAWAAARVGTARPVDGDRAAALQGAKVGVPFALLAWVCALVFRFGPPTEVAVGAGEALTLALAWGALFGGLGGWWSRGASAERVWIGLERLGRRSPQSRAGLAAGVVMLVAAAVGAAVAALVGAWVGLSGVRTRGGSAADLLSGALFVVAFLPNLVAAVMALALGATVEVGARVGVGAGGPGPLDLYSLVSWSGSVRPWYVWLLVIVPGSACALGGFAARRNADPRSRSIEVLGVAALIFAAGWAALAALSSARLGAGLVAARGFARVAPRPGTVFLWALAWAALGGLAGWKVAEGAEGPPTPTSKEMP